MGISVEFAGPVRRPWAENTRTIPFDEGGTVAGLLEHLGFTPSEIRLLWVAVSGELAAPGRVLKDGDRVMISVRMGGG
jgi:sulfur carrier protein ThiS